MTFPPPGSQTLYLYPCKWDASKDELLIVYLIQKIEECRPTPPHLSPHALIDAMKKLNSQLNADVSLNEVEGRVTFLHDRYICFKWLCKVKETYYDQRSNFVHAVDDVWVRLFKENPLSRAYYHEGEPAFLLLCNLFGIHDVKNENSHMLIVIDDSTTVTKQSSSSDDEVTSPVPKPVARKLFVEDACSSVAPSVPNPFKSKIVHPWKEITSKFKRPTNPPVKKNEGGSSCASSSPYK
ncbi:uncharacterized protein LOC131003924 [Salvia miltiorrhiza]|uniref:uncharacterized protein LOC131003924 n=1 Tax=Salvia miltiorrhiza TaxID=226208 RepID=UPI0025AD7070|nr:uncharacterized protein LOC131003924 [Salvia miltiorrhiza]